MSAVLPDRRKSGSTHRELVKRSQLGVNRVADDGAVDVRRRVAGPVVAGVIRRISPPAPLPGLGDRLQVSSPGGDPGGGDASELEEVIVRTPGQLDVLLRGDTLGVVVALQRLAQRAG